MLFTPWNLEDFSKQAGDDDNIGNNIIHRYTAREKSHSHKHNHAIITRRIKY